MRSSPTAVAELQQLTRLSKRKRPPSVLRHRLEAALFRAVAGILRRLPRGFPLAIGRGAARLFFGAARSRREIALANLARAFPEKSPAEIQRIARRSVESFGAALLDFLVISELSREEVLSRVTFSGLEHLAAARRRGHGVFLLSAHFGGWETAAIAIGLLGQPIALLTRPLDNPLLEEELARRRTRFGNRLIQKKDAARELLRAMRNSETVAILMDQNVLREEAVFVPFFGRLAATTPSLALLQLKTDAAVVPIFTWPEENGRYRLGLEEPILAEEFLSGDADRAERVRRATTRYMEVTEAAVRREPAAWLWMHNRWRTRPEGP